ncbi:Glutamate receptor 2.1 [Forsythia ovata]|uniref:Glutamate receptor 2.1 n=1 Tax=Forsythia ovata TaxID=205694 RepID=A0ABD1RIY9_9LAMI
MNSIHSMNIDVIESLQGTLGFKPSIAASSKLQNFTSRWIKEYNSENPYAVFRELPVVGIRAYDMMQALAEAFERVIIETSTVNNQVVGLKSLKLSANLLHSHGGILLLHELSRVRFEGLSGAFQLVDGKLYPEEFKLVNIVCRNEEKMVGIWRPKDGIFKELYSNAIVWPRGCEATTRGLTYEVPYEFVPLSNGTYDDYVHQVCLQNIDGLVGDVTITANRSLEGSAIYQIGTIFWFGFSTLVFAHREKLTSNLSRIIVLVWLFVVLILTSSYTATLSSLLTVQQIQFGSAGEFLGTQLGSSVGGVIANLIFQDQRLKLYLSPKAFIEALSRGHKDGGVDAIIDEIPYIKIILSKYSNDYGMIGSTSSTGGFGFVFPKGSPLVPDISRAIIKLREEGKLVMLEREWFRNTQSSFLPDGAVTNTNILNFNQFRGLFLVSGICLATARHLPDSVIARKLVPGQTFL